jgi:NAD(P)-dependent dehydrogenase (short-subunit alcohol dehydrogenase family)
MTRRTVLITGGSKGIGLGTAEYLLQRDFRVILLARGEAGLEDVRRNLIAAGHSADDIETAVLDMADADAIRQRVPHLRLLQSGLFGRVNNAASEILKRVTDYALDDLEQMWRVNMRAPVLMIQACYPMLKKASGSVVNVGSISDYQYWETYSVYGGSKAFLNAFTGHAGKELGFEGIRINAVSPAGVDTPLMRQIVKQFDPELIKKELRATPIEQRWGKVEEVAEAIHFCLTGPKYFHGADLRIHGGAAR